MTNREKLLKANNSDPRVYQNEVEAKMAETHTNGDELAILRKAIHALASGQPLPQEFADYYAEAESKKASVRQTMNL